MENDTQTPAASMPKGMGGTIDGRFVHDGTMKHEHLGNAPPAEPFKKVGGDPDPSQMRPPAWTSLLHLAMPEQLGQAFFPRKHLRADVVANLDEAITTCANGAGCGDLRDELIAHGGLYGDQFVVAINVPLQERKQVHSAHEWLALRPRCFSLTDAVRVLAERENPHAELRRRREEHDAECRRARDEAEQFEEQNAQRALEARLVHARQMRWEAIGPNARAALRVAAANPSAREMTLQLADAFAIERSAAPGDVMPAEVGAQFDEALERLASVCKPRGPRDMSGR